MNNKYEQIAAASVEIPSPYAKKWYDIGFLFAVNYFYAKLAESTDPEFTQAKFRAFCIDCLNEDVIDDDYFRERPFFDNNSNYPRGQCPGDLPNTCIPCTAEFTTLIRGSTE